MVRYALLDLTLEVEHLEGSAGRELDQVLAGLSWRRMQAVAAPPSLTLSIRCTGGGHEVPASAREVLRADGYRGFEDGGDYYLIDGATFLHVRSRERRGEVLVAPSFSSRTPESRHQFWMFALVKLLQGVGVYSLHAAGLVAPDGAGVLLVGDSGSGKSTLTIGLIRLGWKYLSDDAILLRIGASGVEALALRRHFYVDGSAAGRYAEFSLGEEFPDTKGGSRRRIAVDAAYAAQRVPSCVPEILLFTRIVPRAASALAPVEPAIALGRLLAQCAREAFDRETTAAQLRVLNRLLRQTRFFDLEAGSDLYENPALLEGLLAEAPRTAGALS